VLLLPNLYLTAASNYQLIVGYLDQSAFTQAKAELIALLFDGVLAAPQTKEQSSASANQPLGACNGLTGSRCALI
jgi:hypothetical protein